MPPQSTVSVDVLAFQVPVQPVRFDVPSVIAEPVNAPSTSTFALPFNAMPLLANAIAHAFCVTHSGALAARSPQPCPLSVIA